jgi:hypothetical protein
MSKISATWIVLYFISSLCHAVFFPVIVPLAAVSIGLVVIPRFVFLY